MKLFSLMISDKDKANLLNIIDSAPIRGIDAEYVCGLKKMIIHSTEEIEEIPPEPGTVTKVEEA